jgi:hypothetical protein
VQSRSAQGAAHVGVDEVLADKEERLVERLRQGVGEAVAKIEPGWVATTFAEAPVSIAGNPRLMHGNRLDGDVELLDDLIELRGGARVRLAINDDGGLEKVAADIRVIGDVSNLSR